MRIIVTIIYSLTFLLTSAQDTLQVSSAIGNERIVNSYVNALQRLSALRDSSKLINAAPVPDAYSFQLYTVPTLYSSPLAQKLRMGDEPSSDIQLQRLGYINNIFANIYINRPSLIMQTQSELNEGGALRQEENVSTHVVPALTDQIKKSEFDIQLDDNVQAKIRRPNFWKLNGRFSAQFQQTYFSNNWYQGGEGNYAGNFSVRMSANYDNQKNIKWENILEAQLGFQTSESDTVRTFRPTNNLIRLTTNFGYKAYKQLSYSLQVVLSTQLVPNKERNSTNVISDIFSPLDAYVAPGMKYNIDWGKKVKFTGTVNVAPLAYNVRYVDRKDLASRYGIEEGKQSKHTFGPNIDIRTRLTLSQNIYWDSRIFWFSNFEMTKIEWENTFTFKINKYLNSQLYIYPRFEDSSIKYRTENGSYWMFKEWLSLGLTYEF